MNSSTAPPASAAEYPHPCVRCGFCCVCVPCPLAMLFYGIGKDAKCPALSFDGDVASCSLVKRAIANGADTKAIGIGKGCCIKARCIKNGVEHDFAGLPEGLKKGIAQDMRTLEGVP